MEKVKKGKKNKETHGDFGITKEEAEWLYHTCNQIQNNGLSRATQHLELFKLMQRSDGRVFSERDFVWIDETKKEFDMLQSIKMKMLYIFKGDKQ